MLQEEQVYYTANKLAPFALKPLNIKYRNSAVAASINKDFTKRDFLLCLFVLWSSWCSYFDPSHPKHEMQNYKDLVRKGLRGEIHKLLQSQQQWSENWDVCGHLADKEKGVQVKCVTKDVIQNKCKKNMGKKKELVKSQLLYCAIQDDTY